MGNHQIRINYVDELDIDNHVMKRNEDFREGVKWLYRRLSSEDSHWRPKLDGLHLIILEKQSWETLEQTFSEEILKGLIQCKKNKAPGPNGFTMGSL